MILDARETQADALLNRFASHVEDESKGDGAKILIAGLDIRSDAQPGGELPAPEGFTVSSGDRDGSLDTTWDRVRGARSYLIQIFPDPATATSWTQIGAATKSSYTVTSPESGKKYWLRWPKPLEQRRQQNRAVNTAELIVLATCPRFRSSLVCSENWREGNEIAIAVIARAMR